MIGHLGLEPVGRIFPEEPQMTRPADHVGELPVGYGLVDYANLGFHEDDVLVTYDRKSIHPRRPKEHRVVVIPTSWFYE